MKEIIEYQADDGTIWSTKARCLGYEALQREVDKIMSIWPEHSKDDGCNFSNGGGYYQLEREKVMNTRRALLTLVKDIATTTSWVANAIADETVHLSWPQRIIGDYDELRPVSRALNRVACVDDQFREWGQPYYANNPDKGQQRDLTLAASA